MKPFLAFVVLGEPQPWQRAGAVVRNGRVHMFTQKETDEYESRVAAATRLALQQNPTWCELAKSDVHFRIHLYFATPNVRADADNLAKGTIDALMRASDFKILPPKKPGGRPVKQWIRGAFRDDRLIKQIDAAVTVSKTMTPRTEVYLTTASEPLDCFLWQKVAAENGWSPPRAAERQAL